MTYLRLRPSSWNIAISSGQASRESTARSRKPVSHSEANSMMKLSFCALLLLASLASGADPKPGAPEFAVVASPDVKAENLSMVDLRKLFLGDRQFWSSNLRVSLL